MTTHRFAVSLASAALLAGAALLGGCATYRPLALPTDVMSGGGHLNPEAGLGPWPAVVRS